MNDTLKQHFESFKLVYGVILMTISATIAFLTFFVTQSAFSDHVAKQEQFNQEITSETLRLQREINDEKLLSKIMRDLDYFYSLETLTERDRARIRELEDEMRIIKESSRES